MKSLVLLFTFMLLISGCGDTGTTTKSTSQVITTEEIKTLNAPLEKEVEEEVIPEISKKELRITPSTTKVKVGEKITVSTEEDVYVERYQWWASGGRFKNDGASTEWTAPWRGGTYNLVLSATDIKGEIAYKGINITVVAPATIPRNDGTFDAIHALLAQSKSGDISNVTYICVGDSTRAESHHGGEHLFYEIQNRLQNYNVRTHLLAKAGHEAKQFANGTYPSWRNVVERTPNNGGTTIVDICLGINDIWAEYGASSTKQNIKSAIAKIRASRPQTHFVLSMPNRVYHDEYMTNTLKQIYQQLARELHLPLNNVVDALMPSQSSTSYSWYRKDGFDVHLSQSGQHLVAQYILGNMLP